MTNTPTDYHLWQQLAAQMPEHWTAYNVVKFLLVVIQKIWFYPIMHIENYNIAVANVVISLLVIFLGLRLVRRLVATIRGRFLRKTKLDATTREAVALMIHYLLATIVIALALDIANVPIKVFAFVGGALALSLAFGTRTVVSNFINGMVLMVEQPIHIGDFIEIDDKLLRVVDTGALQTKVISHDNVEYMIPNAIIYEQIIRNYCSAENGIIRVKAMLNLEADADLGTIDKLVAQVLKKIKHLLTDRANRFVVREVVDGCYHGEVQMWINLKKGPGRKTTRDQFYRHMLPLLAKHNIRLADTRRRGSL